MAGNYFLFIICWSVLVVDSKRNGMSADTLHFSSDLDEDWDRSRMNVVNADEKIFSRNKRSPAVHHINSTDKHSDTTRVLSGVDNDMVTWAALNDTHNQMIVHWAGAGSDVIMALSKNSHFRRIKSSALFVSYDYGVTFTVIPTKLNNSEDSPNASLDKFYNSPKYNSHYIFTDVTNKLIFTTRNYGKNMLRIPVPFRPKTISMHPNYTNYVLAYDEDDVYKKLWLSKNFGNTWTVLQSNVKAFFWGVEPFDNVRDLYVQRTETLFQASQILKIRYLNKEYISTIFTDVTDFEVKSDYMFATRNARHPVTNKHTLELWISHKRGPFQRGAFDNANLTHLDYYFADTSEEQIFVCVNHNKTVSHLYISDTRGLNFSLSLERVVFYNPKGALNKTWLHYYVDRPFADIHRIRGLRGIYIASQLMNETLTTENTVSFITYDKGGSWERIHAPYRDSNGHRTRCSSYWSYYMSHSSSALDPRYRHCSLQFFQNYNHNYPATRATRILSRDSAPGLIMASGFANYTLKARETPNIYLSRDGGNSWNEVQKGYHYYAFGDHGGLIITIEQFAFTGLLNYSWNEGETWDTLEFSKEKIRVYGVLTEPGEHTTVFSIFGSKKEKHSWILIQVNLSSIFGKVHCSIDDYKTWSPSDSYHFHLSRHCLLGRKIDIQRKRAHSRCLNGRNFVREKTETNCSCTVQDYECDYGYMKRYIYSSFCIRDTSVPVNSHNIPSWCREGLTFTRSKGYRKVPGDTCNGGSEHNYSPDLLACPLNSRSTDFLLYASRTSIQKYSINAKSTENLNLATNLVDTVVVEYDVQNDCIIWADRAGDYIKKLCRNGQPTVILTSRVDSIEGMSLDYQSDNIYFVDAANKKIEMVSMDGKWRHVLIRNTTMMSDRRHGFHGRALDMPTSIVVDPRHGYMYWTDSSLRHPRIARAYMDGRNISFFVYGRYRLGRPNGLAVDDQSERLFWTDTSKYRICSIGLDGRGFTILIQSSTLLHHPYAIAVFKDDIYWADWGRRRGQGVIAKANKYIYHGMTIVKGNLSEVMDLKAYTSVSQNISRSAPCSIRNRGSCTHFCVPRPAADSHYANRTCLCPDLFNLVHVIHPDGNENCECLNGERLVNGECERQVNGTCNPAQFTCANGNCIPSTYRCDGDDDCHDRSDEQNCPYKTCSHSMFTCSNGKCVPLRWRCDGDNDCGDFSDENSTICVNHTCDPAHFQCNNGRCIPKRWTCDGDNDCHDWTDERTAGCNTTITTISPATCGPSKFQCTSGRCIPVTWKCDGDRDCTDGSDESSTNANCTATACGSTQYKCLGSERHCILKAYICDSDPDCPYGDDEQNCNKTTSPQTYTTFSPGCSRGRFSCYNSNCVFAYEVCDGVNDCGDDSDEYDCAVRTTVRPTTCGSDQFTCQDYVQCIPIYQRCNGRPNCFDRSDERNCSLTTVKPCRSDQFQCDSGRCIPQRWQCDNDNDCGNNEDETNCLHVTCSPNQFRCVSDHACIPISRRCDGHVRDCDDNSDERYCVSPVWTTMATMRTIPPGGCRDEQFRCSDGLLCISFSSKCDGIFDCNDNSDENSTLCAAVKITKLSVNVISLHSVVILWDKPKHVGKISYHPKYRLDTNNSDWHYGNRSNQTYYLFKNLLGGASYLFSLDIHRGTSDYYNNSVIPRKMPDGPPKKPILRNLTQTNGTSISVTWQAPIVTNGQITKYLIYFTFCLEENSCITSTQHVNGNVYNYTLVKMEYGTYTISVKAFTSVEGDISDQKTIKLTRTYIQRQIQGLNVKYHKDGVYLTWTKLEKVTEYLVHYQDPCALHEKYIEKKVKLTPAVKTPNCTIDNTKLTPGRQLFVKVQPVIKDAIISETVIHTKGKTVMRPQVTAKIFNTTLIKVHWTGSPSMNYRVYYAVNGKAIDPERAYQLNVSKALTATIGQMIALPSCTHIKIWVQPIAPLCGLISDPIEKLTGEGDGLSIDIVDLVVHRSAVTVKAKFCSDFISKVNDNNLTSVTYSLKVTLIGVNKNKTTELSFNRNISELENGGDTVSYTLKKLPRGRKYAIRMKLNKEGFNIGSAFGPMHICRTDRYRAPTSLKIQNSPNGSIVVNWNETEDINEKVYRFEVQAGIMNKSQFIVGLSALSALKSLQLRLPDAKVKKFRVYQVRLLVQGNDGAYYNSSFSNRENGQTSEAPAQSSQSTKSRTGSIVPLAVGLTAGVVVLIMAVLLGLYCIKHRRLQRSFLAFANSHYDTRSGRTTLSTDDDDAEDSPMIQGFSDDEPLVVA